MPRACLQDDGKYRDSRIAKYLNDALMTEDTAVIVKAIGDMIRAQGSSSFPRKSSLRGESLYRSFSERMSSGFERMLEVLLALDVKLVVKPLSK